MPPNISVVCGSQWHSDTLQLLMLHRPIAVPFSKMFSQMSSQLTVDMLANFQTSFEIHSSNWGRKQTKQRGMLEVKILVVNQNCNTEFLDDNYRMISPIFLFTILNKIKKNKRLEHADYCKWNRWECKQAANWMNQCAAVSFSPLGSLLFWKLPDSAAYCQRCSQKPLFHFLKILT